MSSQSSASWPSRDLAGGLEPGHDLARLARTGHVGGAGVLGQLLQLLRLTASGLDAEVRVELGAHRLEHVDLGLEGRCRGRAAVADERRVLEVLGPDAGDERRAAVARERPALLVGERHVADRQLTLSPSTLAGMKFIAGEPMKPATKMFSGCS